MPPEHRCTGCSAVAVCSASLLVLCLFGGTRLAYRDHSLPPSSSAFGCRFKRRTVIWVVLLLPGCLLFLLDPKPAQLTTSSCIHPRSHRHLHVHHHSTEPTPRPTLIPVGPTSNLIVAERSLHQSPSPVRSRLQTQGPLSVLVAPGLLPLAVTLSSRQEQRRARQARIPINMWSAARRS